jgi:type IV secretion system protein VirB4
MAVLFNRLERLIDGRRVIFIIDEGWKAIGDNAFAAVIQNAFKTYRKLNAPVIFGTQSPRDALVSDIGHTIREQSPTIISFANTRAIAEDYCEGGLGLTPREFDIVRQLRPGAGVFLLKQGGRSVVAHLPLEGMGDDLAVLSGNERNVRLLDAIRAELGDDDPELLITRFHQRRKAA